MQNPAPFSIHPIPVLRDNYVWVIGIRDDPRVVVVDPGEADPVLDWLGARGARLVAQIVTHHHRDHTAGLARLRAETGAPVLAPAGEYISPCDRAVAAGERIALLDGALLLEAIAVPGHTLGALAWLGPGFVCTGDTLFAAGCGRLFEGTPAAMHASLQRLAALPAELQVLCGHEYTLANLAFAGVVEPHNPALPAAVARARQRLDAGVPSLPTTIAEERAVNPFLRTGHAEVRVAAEARAGRTLPDEAAVFATLRAWKDTFTPPSE